MAEYVSPDDLQTYFGSTITTDYTECEVVALAASDAVDDFCQRTFTAVTAETDATERLFVPSGGALLRVHDIADITDLVITEDGAAVAAADYQLEISPGTPGPYNVAGQYRPYAYVRRLSGTWGCSDEATVSITARWGWTAVPSQVPLACRIIAKDYFAMGDSRFGFVQVGDFSRRITENTLATGILSSLRRVEAWGIA